MSYSISFNIIISHDHDTYNILRMARRLGEQERVRLRGLLVERDTLLAERNIELTDALVPQPVSDFHNLFLISAVEQIWHT